VRDALAGVPETERALLELRLAWPELEGREALIAARLRVFLLTWEPFEWMRDRDTAWATATGDGDSYEVVLYLMLHDAVRRARDTARTIAAVIGELTGSVLAVGAAHEELLVSGAYPQLAFAGEVPGLLSELGSGHTLPAAEIALAASGWEPIGLGAIQDLAQERYGPVDLDRSRVRLEPATDPTPDCPACAGGRFGFPAELDEQRMGMCAEHAAQAQRVITERLERAPASNRDGWDAIVGGASMLSEPTLGLPLWLLGGLQNAADRDRSTPASEAELRADAELALELSARLTGKPEVFAELMSVDGIGDTWLIELPMALAWRGLVDEAVRVGDALAALDQDNRAMFANDVAVIGAAAGRMDRARAPRHRRRVRRPLRQASVSKRTRQMPENRREHACRAAPGERTRRARRASSQTRLTDPGPRPAGRLPRPAQLPQPRMETRPARARDRPNQTGLRSQTFLRYVRAPRRRIDLRPLPLHGRQPDHDRPPLRPPRQRRPPACDQPPRRIHSSRPIDVHQRGRCGRHVDARQTPRERSPSSKHALSREKAQALCRTRTDDPFLTMEV
jgi:hypothetical protein